METKTSNLLMKNIYLMSFLILVQITQAQTQTIGWFQNSNESYDGYTLFSPLPSTETYLIDNCGKLIHSWSSSYRPGISAYLMEDGNLLRTGVVNNTSFNAGGSGGIIEKIEPNNNVAWSYTISDETQCQHHDIEYLPNGNILVIVWELKTESEAIAAGRDPSSIPDNIFSEKIIEIDLSDNTIVWEWHVWDHLVQDYDNTKENYGVVADNPDLINLNYYQQVNEDWLHFNSIDYNADLDQILISNHNFCEVWIIDHSTTTAEATEHTGGNSEKGGDLLFRWGNPATYDTGTPVDKVFFGQHDARWILSDYPGDGGIMVFNNGVNRPAGDYSTIDVIDPVLNGYNYDQDVDGTFLPVDFSWQYVAPTPTDFYSSSISGAERQPNGNTLICEGETGHFFEVDLLGNIVWEYINPVSGTGPMDQGTTPGGTPPTGNPNGVFRVKRYNQDYQGLQDYDLTPGEPIEINPIDYSCETYTNSIEFESGFNEILVYPNPFTESAVIDINCLNCTLEIYNIQGILIKTISNTNSDKVVIEKGNMSNGLYFIIVKNNTEVISKGKFIIE